MTEDVEREWLDRIETDYGVRLGPGQLYVQRNALYAGSEYICSHVQDGPDHAEQWTGSIHHFPRGCPSVGLLTSTRR